MHDHNNNDKGMRSMMWMMVICCALPLVLILLFGAGGKALGAPSWVVFGAIAVMIIAHLFLMRRPRERSDKEHEMAEEDKNNDSKDGKTHSGHGCCQ